jgi:hypothetical protein
MGERPKVPKQAPRNFWIQGVEGWTEDDGSFFVPDKAKVITGGNRRVTGGFNLNIYQRVSRDPYGVVHATRIEGRAGLDGWLTLKVWPVSKGNLLVPSRFRSNREGIPGEAYLLFDRGEEEGDDKKEG